MNVIKKYLTRKGLLGLTFGLVLAIIVLNVDKKLWIPLELETINGRNTSTWSNENKINKKDIAIVLFDDKTQFLLRLNGLPIKDFEKKGRGLIKTQIEKLESYGVRAIGLNLNLSSPSNHHEDEELTRTISKFKNIVVVDSIHSFPSYQSNSILKSASGVGYGELYADYDKIVHKVKLIDKGYKDIQSFSYLLYKTFSQKDVNDNLRIKNEFYLKYPKTLFSTYSFIDLVQGRIKVTQLKDKIVILGVGLKSKLMRDQLFSPYNRDIFISDSEVQAVALSNLLSDFYLFRFSLIDYPLYFILLSMFLGIFFSNIQTVKRLTLGVSFFLGLVIFSQLSYSYFQAIVELVPLLFLLLGNLVISSLIFLQLNLQEQNIELEEALKMLNKRSKELENSRGLLEDKNLQLTNTLSELNKRVNELQEVRKQLSSRSEDERKRIARELHDDTLSRITDLKRHIESILNSQSLPVSEKRQLGVSVQTLDNVTQEIRRIINALRPSMLDNALGLIPAVENLLDDLSRRSSYKIQTKLTTSLLKLKLQETEEINLYRIIQEALNNIFKHSYATKVEIFVEEQPGQILVLVSDNGVGFTVSSNKSGFGLVDMKERAELIGAQLQFLKKPNKTGTILEITIPRNEEARNHRKKETEKAKEALVI